MMIFFSFFLFSSSFWNGIWGEEDDGDLSGRGSITAIKAQVESGWLLLTFFLEYMCIRYIDHLYIYP